MKIILEWTTNVSPINLDYTFEYYNINAETRILRTFPTRRVEVTIKSDHLPTTVMGVAHANNFEVI